MATGQAERLMPMLEELLAEAGTGWRDLAAIGVGTGPGSFTGVRIAVAAARGLALGLGIPAIGVTAFEAAAEGVARPCRVVLPTRGDTLAWQDFGPHGPLGDPRNAAAEALPPGPPPAIPALPVAVATARIAAARLTAPGPRPAPLYLRPADAAPPRDRDPAIRPR